MSTIFRKTKSFLLCLMFYPIFLVLYYLYAIGYKIISIAQDIFTFIYIEQLCGFKRKDKIVHSINAFTKVPQDLVIAYEINKFMFENNNDPEYQSEVQNKILNQHINILTKVNNIKRITLYIDSQYQFTQTLIRRLQHKIHSTQSQKQINILYSKNIKKERKATLEVPTKGFTPFLIVFSNYEEVCNIPSRYLVNAQIAFNPQLFASTSYHIYKGFAQYAESKQRNGK